MPGIDFSPSSILWMFLILAGGWLLINALVDLSGPRLGRWTGNKLKSIWHSAGAVLERAHDRVIEPRMR